MNSDVCASPSCSLENRFSCTHSIQTFAECLPWYCVFFTSSLGNLKAATWEVKLRGTGHCQCAAQGRQRQSKIGVSAHVSLGEKRWGLEWRLWFSNSCVSKMPLRTTRSWEWGLQACNEPGEGGESSLAQSESQECRGAFCRRHRLGSV